MAIARECRLARAALHAYVVMPHHLHMVLTLNERMNGPQFMERFKRQTSPSILRLLTDEELAEFDAQRGLNRNSFWKYSFRSVPIHSEAMFWQKVRYTHLNPVRAGYADTAESYRWSSSKLYLAGQVSEGWVLPYEAVAASVSANVDDE
jgi:REP element-mobilizing transposase RayT